MVDKFRHDMSNTRPWDTAPEPERVRKRMSSGELGALAMACSVGGIGFVAGASVISAAGMNVFAAVTMVLFVTAIVASVRARRQP